MYKKCLLRIPLFTALFILVMIQRVTSFPQKFNGHHQTNTYEEMSTQFQFRPQNFSMNGNMGMQGKRQGNKEYDSIKFEETIGSPLSAYFNTKVPPTTPRTRLDYNLNDRTKFMEQKRPPVEAPDINSRIVFPDEQDIPIKASTSLRVNPSCQGATLCENVTNYPEALLNDIIGRSSGQVKLFAGTHVKLDIAQRLDFAGDSALCTSEERIMYPQAGLAENQQWLFIVNVKNFTQGVRVETCSNEGSECNFIGNDILEGYRTICKQNYIVQYLAAFSQDGKEISQQPFKLPSSCCCHVKFLGNAQNRMG